MREDLHTNTPEAAEEYEKARGKNSGLDDRPTRAEIEREEAGW